MAAVPVAAAAAAVPAAAADSKPGSVTADLVVLALFFFARSSPRFEAWLRSRPVIQRILNRYEGGLTRGTKVQATLGN